MAKKKAPPKKINILGGLKKAVSAVKKVASSDLVKNLVKTAISFTPLGAGLNVVTKSISGAKNLGNLVNLAKSAKSAGKAVSSIQAITALAKKNNIPVTPQTIAVAQKALETNQPIKIIDQQTLINKTNENIKEAEQEEKQIDKTEQDKQEIQKTEQAITYSLFDDVELSAPMKQALKSVAKKQVAKKEVKKVAKKEPTKEENFKAERKKFDTNIKNTIKNIGTVKAKIKKLWTIVPSDKKAKSYELDSKLGNVKTRINAIIKEVNATKNLNADPMISMSIMAGTGILARYNNELISLNKEILSISKSVDDFYTVKSESYNKVSTAKTDSKVRTAKNTGSFKNKIPLIIGGVLGIGVLAMVLKNKAKAV